MCLVYCYKFSLDSESTAQEVDKSVTKCYFLIEANISVDQAAHTVEDTCKLTPGGVAS